MLKLASTLPGALSPLVLTLHPRILLCLSTPSSVPNPTSRSGCLPRLPGPRCQLHQPPGVCTWPSLPVPATPRSSTLRPWSLEGSPCSTPLSSSPWPPASQSCPSLQLPPQPPAWTPSLEPVELPFLCLLGNQNQVGCPPLLHMSMCVSGCAHVSLCARVCVCMCVYMCLCVHVCVRVSVCAHAHLPIRKCCMPALRAHVHTGPCKHVRICTVPCVQGIFWEERLALSYLLLSPASAGN